MLWGLWRGRLKKDTKERLPRTDIPPNYKCPYPDCSFKVSEESKRKELAYRNHMAVNHGVYYEKAPPTETANKLAQYTRHGQELEKLQEISQLASWHCRALAEAEVSGLPLSTVAKQMRHSVDTLRAVARSPAGQKYLETIRANMHDPVRVVRDLLAAGTVNKLLDWERAWQQAVDAKDYQAVHRMAKEIGLQPALEATQQQGPTKISLHLNLNDLAAPAVKTSFTVLEAEVVEEPETDSYE